MRSRPLTNLTKREHLEWIGTILEMTYQDSGLSRIIRYRHPQFFIRYHNPKHVRGSPCVCLEGLWDSKGEEFRATEVCHSDEFHFARIEKLLDT